jgi:hypothetical protein
MRDADEYVIGAVESPGHRIDDLSRKDLFFLGPLFAVPGPDPQPMLCP